MRRVSKTRIRERASKKTNLRLRKLIAMAMKHEAWLEVAKLLARPKRKRLVLNLKDIDKQAKEGEIIVVPGKVLSAGEITKKVRIVAYEFSKAAEEKIKKVKAEIVKLEEEIQKNPEAKNIKIIS